MSRPFDLEATVSALPQGGAADPRATLTPRSQIIPTLPAGAAGASAEITLPELPRLSVAYPRVDAPDLGGADLEVLGVLGEGGMGRVLLARQRSLRREVALKRVKDDAAPDEDLQLLLVEALVTGALEHPSIVPVHALGRDDAGKPLLIMKRIEGVAWSRLAAELDHPIWTSLAPGGEDRLDVHLEILMTLCNAVHFAHSRGIVHRDLKPDNVMIGAFGEVYLVDWGIALDLARLRRAQAAGEPRPPALLVGSPAFMAPEMVRADPRRIDERTDVYLLGATLHAVLTGAPRHTDASLMEALSAAILSAPVAYGPEVPAELGAICNRATSVEPAARFPSALALRVALADFRRHRGSVTLSDEAAARLLELQHLLAAGGHHDDPRTSALMTECRFGFMQALRAWRGNQAAAEGLAACLAAMIDHEIAQRDAAGARQLYADLVAPQPALLARIEALEAELRDAAARKERLEAQERDRDPSIGAGAQALFLAIMAVGAAAITAFFVGQKSAPSHRVLTVAPLVMATLVVALAWILRRHLQTALARRLVASIFLVPVMLLAHRLTAFTFGQSTATIFAADLWIAVTICLVVGVTMAPLVAWAGLPMGLGAIAITRYPDFASRIFGGCLIASSVILFLTRSVKVR